MFHAEITDSTGRTWVSDAHDEDPTPDELAEMADLFGDFKSLNRLSLVVDGAKHFFNPAHVISIALVQHEVAEVSA